MIDIIPKGKLVEYAVIALATGFLMLQVHIMSLLETVSSSYTAFYFNTFIIGAWMVVVLAAFGIWYLTVNPLGLDWRMQLAIILGFNVFILVFTAAGNQIWPVPKAFDLPMDQLRTEVTPLQNYLTSAVIPGWSEDLVFLFGWPAFLLLLYMVPRTVFFGKPGGMEFIIVAAIACLVASTGYGTYIIPGFTSAHVPAYGQAGTAYVGAWIFSAMQSFVYFVTGLFIPTAHMLHNAVIVHGQLYAIALMGLILPAEGSLRARFGGTKTLYVAIFLSLFAVLAVSGCLGGETAGENLDQFLNKTGQAINGSIEWWRSP